MKKIGRWLLVLLAVILGIFGAVGMISTSAAGGAVSLIGAALIWPSIGDRIYRATGKVWLAPVVGVLIAVLVGPIVAAATAPSAEEAALIAEQRELRRAEKDKERAITDAKKKEEQRIADAKEAEEKRQKKCSDTTMAFVMSQSFVKQALKSPSTAEFPYVTADGVSTQIVGECKFRVRGYVDSQNGFGAMLRSKYIIDMTYHPDSKGWSGSNLRM